MGKKLGGNVQIQIGNHTYDVVIEKKRGVKNTYLRVKKDLKLYVSTSILVSDRKIKQTIEENMPAIVKMYEKQLRKQEENSGFSFLGKKYEPIITSGSDISLGKEKVFIGREVKEADLDKWYKKQAQIIFPERLDYWVQRFDRKIPYPSLTIRKMTSRWGVCNAKLKRVTLNLELIKKDPVCLDYVIVHELSHFIELNHSARFWKVVESNYPNYREIRKIMKNY